MESKNNKNGNKLKKKLHEMAEAFAIKRFLKTPRTEISNISQREMPNMGKCMPSKKR